jgi:hypothetical protein
LIDDELIVESFVEIVKFDVKFVLFLVVLLWLNVPFCDKGLLLVFGVKFVTSF